MQIKEIMASNIVSLLPTNTLFDATKAMKYHDVGFLVIKNEHQKLVGVLTDRDIVLKIASGKPLSTELESVMKKNVVTINENQSIPDATDAMGNMQIRRLVVVDNYNHPVGILSLGDLAKEVLLEEYAFEALSEICYDFRQNEPKKVFHSEIYSI